MERFDGSGFSKGPIEGDEAAKLRHMFQAVSHSWVNIEDINTLINGARLVGSIVKWGGGMGVTFAAVGAFAKVQGWI